MVSSKNVKNITDKEKEVMEMAMYKGSMISIIIERQIKLLVHICRKNGIEKKMLCGKVEG